tara:strand:+ start:361 stop:819 length:459 start_codon:yes stop_codon:yes gene_type:complete
METLHNFLINNYLWIKSFHVISVIAWMAAMLYLPRLFVYHSTVEKNTDSSEMLKTMEYRLQKFIMNPAMIFSVFFGSLLLLTKNIVNWQEVWIYIKLFSVFCLVLVHYKLSKYRQDFFNDNNKKTKNFYKIINEIPTILLIIIIIMVYIKPF